MEQQSKKGVMLKVGKVQGGGARLLHDPHESVKTWKEGNTNQEMFKHGDTHLKCCKHEHLFFSTINLFIKKLPLGLLIDLVDSHSIIFWVQVIEWIELEAKAQCVIFPHTLLHDGQWRVQPPVRLQQFSNINLFSVFVTSSVINHKPTFCKTKQTDNWKAINSKLISK